MAKLSGDQFLSELKSNVSNPIHIGQLFDKVITYVNTIGASTATEQGDIAPPPPPVSVSVKTGGEQVHVSISHPGAIQKGVQYFTEIGVNDPGFKQPIVIDHGASRTSHPFVLPTNDDNGAQISYYARSYAQYLGGKRSGYAFYGPSHAPTAIKLSGTTNMTPLSSTGSGTASNDGSQGGQGLGNDLYRPAPTAKRTTGSIGNK